MSSNVMTGKAFEYATLTAFYYAVQACGSKVVVDVSSAYSTAKKAFLGLDSHAREDYKAAALVAAQTIIPMEPGLTFENGKSVLRLCLQTDAKGQSGDVRDIVLSRPDQKWEIGISCKHNHQALKHPRITEGMDFGRDWIGVPCSREFIERIETVMRIVKRWEDERTKWCDHGDKVSSVYVPIVEAFVSELRRLCSVDDSAPSKIVSYFFGTDDFYKVISQDRRQPGDAGITRIVPFNMGGTLGRTFGEQRPVYQLDKTELPTRLIEVGRKEKSSNTLEMVFDKGWTISMRVHNADKLVKKTGLKWDVQLVGVPYGVDPQIRIWGQRVEYGVVGFDASHYDEE